MVIVGPPATRSFLQPFPCLVICGLFSSRCHIKLVCGSLQLASSAPSVGIDLKELGADVEMFEFCTGMKFETDFHSKMSVCRHELGRGFNLQTPAIPTLSTLPSRCRVALNTAPVMITSHNPVLSFEKYRKDKRAPAGTTPASDCPERGRP